MEPVVVEANPHKKIYLIAIGVALVLLLIGLTYLYQRRLSSAKIANQNKALATTNSPQSQQPNQTDLQKSIQEQLANIKEHPNRKSEVVRQLMINKKDLDAVHNDFNKELIKRNLPTPTVAQYKFKYELAPGLKKQPQSFNFVKEVNAATLCDASSLSTTVKAYSLRSHVTEYDAKTLAASYSIKSKTYSQPAAGDSFSFFFSDSNAFLTLYEASGLYNYHQIIKTSADGISLDETKKKAEELLLKYKLNDNLKVLSSSNTTDKYIFDYQKDWGLPLIDDGTVKSSGGGVCTINSSSLVNKIDLQFLKDGSLSEVNNTVRQQISTYTLTRQDLDGSLADFADNPPIPPVVVGADTTGAVTITDVRLVYYDFGGNYYAQKFYIPMYLTSGTTSSGTKVYTFLPAVSAETLISEGLSDKYDYENIRQSQQQGQIGEFKTLTPPTPPPITGAPGDPTNIGSRKAVGACFGGLIDYFVECTSNGQLVCMAAYSTGTDNDPLQICKNGGINSSGIVRPTSGSDVCLSYLKSKNIPTDGYHSVLNNGGSVSGEVYCTAGANPC